MHSKNVRQLHEAYLYEKALVHLGRLEERQKRVLHQLQR